MYIHKQDEELVFFVPVPMPEFNSTGSLEHKVQQIFLKQFLENRARARARARNQLFIHDVYKYFRNIRPARENI